MTLPGNSDSQTRAELASTQKAAAFTRKAIATRRAQGLRTSQLEERLAALLHKISVLRAQLPRRPR